MTAPAAPGSARGGPFTLAAPASAEGGWTLPDDFWASFHRTHWERQGCVIRRPLSLPLLTAEELFDCLVAASDRFRAGDRLVQLELCVEHAQLLADVGRHLPERADGSAAGWARRVTGLLGGRTFGLVVEDVQAYYPALWLRLRDALGGLLARTGLPALAKATVFLGNYESTPFGLHRGSSGNLMFVVEGPKRMRTWPDAYFRGKEDYTYRLDYHAHDPHSIVLDAEAGDVIYWPSDYWHVGERVGEGMSSAVSVALFMDRDPAEELLARARPFVRRHVRMAEGPEAALANAAADPAFARELRAAALRHATALGFARPPAPLPPTVLGDDEVVRGSREHPVRWTDLGGGTLAVAACGHAFGLTASPLARALLERLADGGPHRVGDLARDFSGVSDDVETTPESVRAVLGRLVSLRGLTAEG